MATAIAGVASPPDTRRPIPFSGDAVHFNELFRSNRRTHPKFMHRQRPMPLRWVLHPGKGRLGIQRFAGQAGCRHFFYATFRDPGLDTLLIQTGPCRRNRVHTNLDFWHCTVTVASSPYALRLPCFNCGLAPVLDKPACALTA